MAPDLGFETKILLRTVFYRKLSFISIFSKYGKLCNDERQIQFLRHSPRESTSSEKKKFVRSKISRVSGTLYYSKYKKEGSLSICKQLEPIRKSFLPRIRMSIARLPKVVKRAKLCSRVTVYTTLGPLYSRHKTFSRSSKLSEKYG